MKKYLHGRRHIRARASVQVGREKRRMHKLNREMALISRIDWYEIGQSVMKAITQVAEAACAMGAVMHKIIRDIHVDAIIKNLENKDGLSKT